MGHWKPKFTYRTGTVKKIAGFSGNVLGFSAINYWAVNGDNFLIGKVLGAVQLGYYSQAYKLLWLSQHLFLGVINQTLLPVLSLEAPRRQKGAQIHQRRSSELERHRGIRRKYRYAWYL